MRLSDIFTQLKRDAARTGEDRGYTLPHGARIAVRVLDGLITLTVSRRHAPVGDIELNTFRAHCNVPAHARRIPEEGQAQRIDGAGDTWHYVAFCWQEEAQ